MSEKLFAQSFAGNPRHLNAAITDLSVRFSCNASQQLLSSSGMTHFQDFWNLPQDFVDTVNFRRGGWSATSKFKLSHNGLSQEFFLKRQANQRRYSLCHPFGALTYRYELKAIEQNISLGLPAVEVLCSGFRIENGQEQGFIVTRAIKDKALSELQIQSVDWEQWMPVLEKTGRLLLGMHRQHISHGALFPNHLFMNPRTGRVHLIDFERSRHGATVNQVIRRDLTQLLRRTDWIPDLALDRLLTSYRREYPDLISGLLRQFRPKKV